MRNCLELCFIVVFGISATLVTPDAGSIFPADPPQFYQVPFAFHAIDPIKESLIDAGFSDISVHIVALEKEILDAASFARGLVYGNPLIDEIRIRAADPQHARCKHALTWEKLSQSHDRRELVG
jgi:hypothetical protein